MFVCLLLRVHAAFDEALLVCAPKNPVGATKIALSNEKRIFTMGDAYCDPGTKLSCFQLKMVFYQSLEITRASSYG